MARSSRRLALSLGRHRQAKRESSPARHRSAGTGGAETEGMTRTTPAPTVLEAQLAGGISRRDQLNETLWTWTMDRRIRLAPSCSAAGRADGLYAFEDRVFGVAQFAFD